MKRIVRWITTLLLVLFVLILATTILIDANRFRPALESELTAALKRQIKLGDLKLALVSSGVTASDLSIADDPAFSREPFLRARSLHVSVEILPFLFKRQLHITGLTIEEPEIVLLQNAAGVWNFSTLGARSAPKTDTGSLDLSVKLVKISNGKFTFAKAASLEKVNLELRDFSSGSSFPFELSARVHEGGEIQLKGKTGPLNPDDSSRTPFEASLRRSGVVLQTGAGIASLEGAASSDGGVISIQGRAKVEKLKLSPRGAPAARVVELDCSIRHDFQKHAGSLTQGQVHIGKAVASLTGTYLLAGDAPPVLHARLSGDRMPLPELVAMLPALNIVLPAGSSIQGGTLGVHVSADGPINGLSSAGTLKIEKARLASFDLGAKMSVIEHLAGVKTGADTEIESCDVAMKSSPAGATVESLRVNAPAVGELSGSGSISPEHALDFRMRATLHSSNVVIAALGTKGDTAIPFSVQGTAMNPIFKPDVKGMVTDRLKTAASPAGLIGGFLKKKLK
jgi:AsmA protein